MDVCIDLTNTERRVSTAEVALRMNISEKELYDRIKSGRVKRPIKDGVKITGLIVMCLPVFFMRKIPFLHQIDVNVVL